MIYSIIYVSSAIEPFSNEQLVDLLALARAKNSEKHITGMLLYHDGDFMQVIEGEKNAVLTLFAKLCLDPRHQNVMTLMEGEVEARSFSEWSMGFKVLSDDAAASLDGFDDFMKNPLSEEPLSGTSDKAKIMLRSFKKMALRQ